MKYNAPADGAVMLGLKYNLRNRVEAAHLLFIISANFGLLDSWLPVLHELQRRRRVRVCALITNAKMAKQVRSEDLLTELGNRTIDSVLFPGPGNGWRLLESLKDIAQFCEPEERRRSAPSDNVVGYSVVTIERAELHGLLRNVKAVLFDVSQEKLDIVRHLQEGLSEAAWFSLPHGIDVSTEDGGAVAAPPQRLSHVNTTAYVASHLEVAVYEKAYNLKREAIKLVGIPRHSRRWIGHISELQRNVAGIYGNYIFLASRPKNASYFPAERRVAALEDISRLCDEIGTRLVIRRHPKEHDEKTFYRILQADRYGERWVFSCAHPFVLGGSARFCITFFSSVAIDMVAIGTPVIERCNFSDLSTIGTNLVEDINKGVSSTYQQFGLALGAKDYLELRAHARQIMEDRDSAVRLQMNAYKNLYATLPNPIDLIADDIERSLREAQGA